MQSFVWGIFWVVFFFGGSIFIHEFGHFWAAKRLGLRVPCFSIGFGPQLIAWECNGTKFKIALIPLGGYVSIPQLGEINGKNAPDLAADNGNNCTPISPGGRIFVFSMGAIFNVLTAFSLATVLWIIGLPVDATRLTTTIGGIPSTADWNGDPLAHPPAENKLKIGDEILAVDGVPLRQFSRLPQLVAIGTRRDSMGNPISEFTVRRDGGTASFPVPVSIDAESEGLRHLRIFPAQELIAGKIMDNSPAQRAGMATGDRMVSADEIPFKSFDSFNEYLQQNGGRKISLALERGGERIIIPALPAEIKVRNAHYRARQNGREIIFVESDGKWEMIGNQKNFTDGRRLSEAKLHEQFPDATYFAEKKHYALGLFFAVPQKIFHQNPAATVAESAESTWQTMGSLLNRHSEIGARHLIGAPGIARILHHLALNDFRHLIAFVIQLNVGLAMLNLLPIPGLDGGQMAFVILEKILRRPLHPWILGGVQFIFLYLLIALMAYVSFGDIRRWRTDRHSRWEALECRLYPTPHFD
ncbi:MAG: RIP metalloprotease RseP [Puniceicoccales bacterium]|jgi:regulator of sigma E protease|nr:RIP metalloprotease RseP [Puniceicoccales bacterium]